VGAGGEGAVAPGDAEAAGLGAVLALPPDGAGEGVAEAAWWISSGVARRTGEEQAASAAMATRPSTARRDARLALDVHPVQDLEPEAGGRRRRVIAIRRVMLGQDSWKRLRNQ